jgi:hypothetical protein
MLSIELICYARAKKRNTVVCFASGLKTSAFENIISNVDNVFCFLSSLPLLTPSHHGSVWLILVICLLLTKTVSPIRACLSI